MSGKGVRGMYILGGVAALLAALVFRRWLGAELGLFGVAAPSAGSPGEWLGLFRDHPLQAVILANGMDIVNYLLVGVIFTALFIVLRERNRPFMTLSLALVFAGVALFISSNKAFALLELSGRDPASPSAAQTAAAMLGSGTMVFGTDMFWAQTFIDAAGLAVSLIMMGSGVFGRPTAWLGVCANGISLFGVFTLALAPGLTAIPASVSAPFRLVWFILIGIRLLRLAKTPEPRDAEAG